MKKILVVLGHPDKESFNGALAEAYAEGAREGGAEVKVTAITDLKFDPILWKGYKERQELEPDLTELQEKIRWAEHLVFIFPIWWGGMPALLKGLFDRMWLPGFAFKFKGYLRWEGLLKGRSARIIVTMNTPKWVYWLLFGGPGGVAKKSVLWFSGIKPVRITAIGSLVDAKEEYRQKWLKRVRQLGQAAK